MVDELTQDIGEDIIPDNKIRASAFLCYFAAIIGGAAYPVCGLVSPQIAAHFGVNVSNVVFIDALSLLGLITGNSFSGKIIQKVGGRKTLVLAGLLLGLAQFGIAIQNLLFVYAALVYCTGFAMGLFVPAVSYIIVTAFSKQNKSNAKLSILNFFFGIGGFLGPSLAGEVVQNTSWRVAFILTSIAFLAVFFRSFFINIGEKVGVVMRQADEKSDSESSKESKPITTGVILVGLALIAYVYTEYVISYWFSPYLQMSLKFKVSVVGFVIGTFWLSMAIGRFVFGELVLTRVKDYKFVITAALVVIVGFLVFVTLHSIALIFVLTIILGFGCASIFPTLLGYGMKQTAKISPITMAFLICCGSIGGAISLTVSSTIGRALNKADAIYMGPVCCALIIIFVLLSRRTAATSHK